DDTVSAITAEAAELLRTSAELDKELRRIRPRRGPRLRSRLVRPVRSSPGEPDEPVLLSLRPVAAGCLDGRILCAFDPPGLAGAGNGPGARDEQRPADASGPGGQQPGGPGAVLLLAASARHAGATVEPDPLLQRAEARYWAMLAADPLPVPGQDAAAGGPVAYDRAGVARGSLAGRGPAAPDAAPDAIAAAVAARARRHRLAEVRARSGLTQAEVADRLGVRQERVSAMERGDVSAMEVRTAAAYVEALGGRLESTVGRGSGRGVLGAPGRPVPPPG